MKAMGNAFKQFLRCIWEDFMVAACIIGPIFMGLAFHFGVPALEHYLCDYLDQAEVLAPYYQAFDLLLLLMTPLLLAFAGVMVMLEEIDNTTAKYLCVTPIGPKGYLISRLGIPVLFSLFYDVVLVLLCGLSGLTFMQIIVMAVLSGIVCVLISIMVVSIARNKVEGMALIKLSGLFIAAALLPFFSNGRETYLAGVFPSFWMGKLMIQIDYVYVIVFTAVCGLWLIGFYKRFRRKFS